MSNKAVAVKINITIPDLIINTGNKDAEDHTIQEWKNVLAQNVFDYLKDIVRNNDLGHVKQLIRDYKITSKIGE